MPKKKIGRPKKAGHYVNCRIRSDLYERLSKEAIRQAQTKTAALEHLLLLYVETDSLRIDKEEEHKRRKRALAMQAAMEPA